MDLLRAQGARWAAALFLTLSLWTGPSWGAGYYSTDVGVRAGLGRAGAFVARADDQTAAWYNPAGFADQKGTHFQLDDSFIKQSIFFQRTDASGQNMGFPVGNTATPRWVPFLGVSSDFGLRDWTFALSAFGPHGRAMRYPELGTQRYTLISTNVTEAFVQLSAAWRPLPKLRIGFAFRYEYLKATQDRKLSISGTPGNEDLNDVGLFYTVTDSFSPNFQLGALWTPHPFLTLGVGWRPYLPVDASGDLGVNAADVERLRQTMFRNLGICGSKDANPCDPRAPGNAAQLIDVTFAMPNILRAGVRVHEPDPRARQWDVELDFVWERWTGFGQLTTVPRNIYYTLASTTPTRLTKIVEDKNYGDAFSLRLGGEVEIIPGRLVLRAGAFYETSAVPARSLSVALVDSDKIGVSFGLSLKTSWLEMSLGYTHIQLFERSVRDSVVRQINLTYLAIGVQDQAPVVGNGIYRSGWDNLGIGLRVSFDALYAALKGNKSR
jgi:long-chain fatty acid transport protein